ncbi:MAG: vitamin B12 dependent methionine synthase, activation domain protein [Clostridia bacterium]|nr:vitamin B12 dependent methionine synthase, activation domain protein [Clostridia bacterium]
MQVSIPAIPMREALHFLGWRGNPVEESILSQIRDIMGEVRTGLAANVIMRYADFGADRRLKDTVFTPQGNDVSDMLSSCHGAILMAATLGAQSERLLLRHQARSSAAALLMDAVLSAAIEAVCDEQECMLREEYRQSGLYLTDRFSPGYGDMPLEQTKEICAVLQTQKTIGLTVSHSGIMIPRKSVTAILGVSDTEQKRRPSQCAFCSMNKTCALREIQ